MLSCKDGDPRTLVHDMNNNLLYVSLVVDVQSVTNLNYVVVLIQSLWKLVVDLVAINTIKLTSP